MTSCLWSGLRGSMRIKKSPGAFVDTFRDFSFITFSRRVEVKDRINANFRQFSFKV